MQPGAAPEQQHHQHEPAGQEQVDSEAQRVVQRLGQPGAGRTEQVARLGTRMHGAGDWSFVAQDAEGDEQADGEEDEAGQVEAKTAVGHGAIPGCESTVARCRIGEGGGCT